MSRALPASLSGATKGRSAGGKAAASASSPYLAGALPKGVSARTAALVQDVWITALVPQAVRVKVLANARLQGLMAELQGCVTGSAAPKTLSRYATPWRQWLAFCEELGGMEAIPAPALEFSLFLLDVAGRSSTEANVKAAKSAASFFHKLAELPPPGKYPMVMTVYASICKRMRTPEHRLAVEASGARTGKACVLSATQIWQLAVEFAQHKDLIFRQAFVVFLVSVGGFFRSGELVAGALLMGDIVDMDRPEFGGEQRKVLLIFVEMSKTDKERNGAWVPLPYGTQSLVPVPDAFRGSGVDCVTPGMWLRRFLLTERLGADPNEPVFGVVAAAARGAPQSIRAGSALSYSRYNEVLKMMGDKIGVPVANLSPHSGRATAATMAAERGVPDRLFKRFGRWKSDRAKDGYVHESVAQLLAVPSAMLL